MLANLAAQFPHVQIVSLEHDTHWFEDTKNQLPAPLPSNFHLHHTPLTHIQLQSPQRDADAGDAHTQQWYDYFPRTQPLCELLLVDGPPGSSSSFARLPAPYMIPMATGGCVVIDDYERDEEQAIVRRWLADLGLELMDIVEFNTTLAVLRKPRWAGLEVKWRRLKN
ncbi:hypothetical protein IQ266_18395 [filamentous cyanobacterium LEGE 11480]|uniref:S-adenosyl-L-methionine-dependent methyltransferase n=2 Tax=Romeriopsis TaxID=2992131 RepID=A0A928VRN1_9CYAN|nr:hypothetical protein [Romeriopsis navalis LEGE 11480]